VNGFWMMFQPFEARPLQIPGADQHRGSDEVLIDLEDLK